MATAIVTGSTRGIGLGLAENFLKQGWNVVVNGRTETTVQEVCAHLIKLATDLNLQCTAAGKSGDITKPQEMSKLFDFGQERFGSVDIWVNNVGVTHPLKKVWELDNDTIRMVIDIDFTGSILTASIVVRKMLQQGHGHIYNMEGFGSNGQIRVGMTVYGAAKQALRFWSRSMALELKGTNVKMSRLSPGMVITDLLTGQYQDNPKRLEENKKIFNILADKVETVTPWLVQKMIANKKNDAFFQWLTPGKILIRFLTAKIHKRQII